MRRPLSMRSPSLWASRCVSMVCWTSMCCASTDRASRPTSSPVSSALAFRARRWRSPGVFCRSLYPVPCRSNETPVVLIGDDRRVLLTEYVEASPAPPVQASSSLGAPGCSAGWPHDLGQACRLAAAGTGWAPRLRMRSTRRCASVAGRLFRRRAHRRVGHSDADAPPVRRMQPIHADLTPPNAVPRGDQPPVIIDWIGVGRGPRVWPLAFLLFVAGPRRARRTSSVTPA